MKTLSLHVIGKVQGVWFRKHTQETALQLGLCGTVENCSDGSVQIIATGTEEQLNQLVKWCQQGPPRAEVKTVLLKEIPLTTFESFRIIRHFL